MKDDSISRQAAIDALDKLKMIDTYEKDGDVFLKVRAKDVVDMLDSLPSAEPEIIRCKDCTHFHYDFWADVNGVPLIVGHEICDFWGNGCKTREDAFCSFAERIEA